MNPFILKNNHVKKTYIQILNIPMTSFILKIKKGYLQTLNISITPIHTKKIIKLKSILTNFKIPGTVFFLIPFFKYYKKHTYEFQNAWHSFLLIPFFKY